MNAEPQPGATYPAEKPIHPFTIATASPAHDLVNTENGFRIRGFECCRCGRKSYPRRPHCLGCAGDELRDCLLGIYGRLYSFTTVHVSSSRATPYTIAYVDLDEGVRLLATFAGDSRTLAPNIPVRLTGATDRWTFEPVINMEAS
jgi:uncharacterized OB-fold protein